MGERVPTGEEAALLERFADGGPHDRAPFGAVGCIEAGWLTCRSGGYLITDTGRAALARYREVHGDG